MVRLDSAKSAGDLSKLRGRVLLGQRRTGQKVLAHREAADEDGLEPDPADEPSARAMAFGSSPAIGTPTGPAARWAISPSLR
jgi:hypothetical protein